MIVSCLRFFARSTTIIIVFSYWLFIYIGWFTYFFLFGYGPFEHEPIMKQFEAILSCDYDFDEQAAHVTPAARNFISRLLTKKEKRMTVTEALTHEWLTQGENKNHKKILGIVEGYKKYLERYRYLLSEFD